MQVLACDVKLLHGLTQLFVLTMEFLNFIFCQLSAFGMLDGSTDAQGNYIGNNFRMGLALRRGETDPQLTYLRALDR